MNTIAGEAAVSLGNKTKSGDLSLALGSLAAAQKRMLSLLVLGLMHRLQTQ